MSTGRERFSTMLDSELEVAKAGQGAFGKLYIQQKAEWVQTQTQTAISNGQTVDSSSQAEFAARFDTEVWDKQQKDFLKTKTMSVYDGQSKETAAENTANHFLDGAGNAVGLGASSFLTGGDFTSGLSHGVRHAALGAIMSIPFVGEFLGQFMAWASSKLTSLFGGAESLSWGEAGDKVERENIKKRIGAEMGQYADVNRLAEMVNESAKEPSSSSSPAPSGDRRGALDTNKDGKINAKELDVVADNILTSADKDAINKQINNQETAQALFEELRQQGVTFENQNIETVPSQSVPAVMPPRQNTP